MYKQVTSGDLELYNHWWNCFLRWLNKPSGEADLLSADVILAQSFGQAAQGPGLNNIELGRVVRELHALTGAPLVLQWEVAEAVPELPVQHVVRKHKNPRKYLDTYEVLVQSWEFCRARGFHKAIVVAHPDQLWRAAHVAQRLGFHVLLPDTRQVTYDPQSTQVWTRRRWLFLPRELVASLLYWVQGRL